MLALLLMASFITTENLQAQGNPAQPAAQRTEKLTPQQILDLNEIAAIRARVGSVGERLQGTLSGIDPNQQFQDSLKDRISEQKSTAQTVLVPVSTPAKISKAPDPHTIQTVLRSTAKALEKLAGQLEQVQFYDKADELRKTATSYWLEARELD